MLSKNKCRIDLLTLNFMVIFLVSCVGSTSPNGQHLSESDAAGAPGTPQLPVPPNPGTPNDGSKQVSLITEGDGFNNQNNINLTPDLIVTFSESMDPATINTQSITLTSQGANNSLILRSLIQVANIPIEQPQPTESKCKTFTFKPSSPLQPNTKYNIVVNNKARTKLGTPAFGSSSFSTGDYKLPQLAFSKSAESSTGLSLMPNLEVIFPNKMLKVSNELISLHEGESNGGTIDIGDIYEGESNHFVFSPLYPLQPLTKYTVVAQKGIKDKYGNQLQASAYSFTTGTISYPMASMLAPYPLATDISTKSVIQIKFSESVNNFSPLTLTVAPVADPSNAAPISMVTASTQDFIYTLALSQELLPNTEYELTFSPKVKDDAGNAVVPASYKFTTSSSRMPKAVLLDPLNNQTNLVSSYSDSSMFQLNFQFGPDSYKPFTPPLQVGGGGSSTLLIHDWKLTLYQNGLANPVGLKEEGNGQNFKWTPTTTFSNLQPFTRYFATLSSDKIVDATGNPYPLQTFSFVTGAIEKFKVRGLFPYNNYHGLNIHYLPTILFNQPISKLTHNAENPQISLHRDGPYGQITPTTIIQPDKLWDFGPVDQLMIAPLDETGAQTVLQNGTTYYLVLESSITDLDGNHLKRMVSSFTTEN